MILSQESQKQGSSESNLEKVGKKRPFFSQEKRKFLFFRKKVTEETHS